MLLALGNPWTQVSDFIVVSTGLWPYILDTQMKRGAELLPSHHLVMNWVRLARRMLEILRFHQEHLAQDPCQNGTGINTSRIFSILQLL